MKHYIGNLEQLDHHNNAFTIYRALRLPKSGSINESNISDGKEATDSYVSDVADRLRGRIDNVDLNTTVLQDISSLHHATTPRG